MRDRREYMKEWKEKNKERIREYNARSYQKNIDFHRARNRENRKNGRIKPKTKAQNSKDTAAFRARNLEKVREWERLHSRNRRERATDGYLAVLMGAPVSEIPSEILELKRLHLKIHREIKTQTNPKK